MLTGPSGGGGRSGQIESTRVGLDRDQLGAGLGAGRGQALSCRRSVQPRVKTEAVAGLKVLGQPVFRRRIDQRLDVPGLAVDLLSRLQRVAAVDEDGGLPRQHDGEPRRAGEAGQPGQPLFGRRRHIHSAAGRRAESRTRSACRRASSSRNAASRAVSATPPSGSSNVWKWASNIAGHQVERTLGLGGPVPQCGRLGHNLA